ncbi:alpha/beta fold hydrolase [Nakamurella endophytica]|uniref:Esterase n=1 Tax=Nakamurella endophytica TaxID=1748367 RepID=A0A917T6K2_9ACTN|nr:alpha/beta hydrolase [Nakamurella endophytica]GGM10897.1 esterase [Nakamurella endophytica]
MDTTAEGLAHRRVGTGPQPLLLLHGLGGDHRQPLVLLDDRLSRRCTAVAPDLRAHGATTLDDGPLHLDFRTLAGDIARLVAGLDVPAGDGWTVVGISLGAAVTAQLLADGAMPIRRAVLVRPAWPWEPAPENLSVFPRIADLLTAHGPEEGLRRFRDHPARAAVQAVSPAAAQALTGQFTAPDAARRAARLRCLPAVAPARPGGPVPPTLVVGSPQDPVHPVAIAQRVAADLDAEHLEVAPRYDAPERHAREVTAALHAVLGT